MADEVYERLYYGDGATCAPSFLDIAAPDERIVSVHSFSKSFLMTGWRLGYAVAPVEVIRQMTKIQQHGVSHPTTFVMWAGVAALTGMLGRFMFPNVLAEPPSTIQVGSIKDYEPEKVSER